MTKKERPIIGTGSQTFDVVVVGAGPAGLGSAMHLAQRGMEVLLLERNEIGATQKAWLTFDHIIEKYGLEESVRNRFSRVTFSCYIGNTYSGATPLGLAAVLDIAQPGERIMAVSYGSGAGSDAFSITVNDEIDQKRDLAPKVQELVDNKSYVDYAVYAKFKGKLRMAGLTQH